MNKMAKDLAFKVLWAAAIAAGEEILKSNPNNFNVDSNDLVKIINILAKAFNH